MNTTLMLSSYDNSTYLDHMEHSYENVTLLGDVEMPDPAASFNAPDWLINVMVSISTWTIVANGLVFLCLVTCRKALKNNVNVQLLSLSFTDMLVGMITIPISLMPKTMRSVKYETCAFLMYTYFVAQSATLFHSCLICVNRLLSIRWRSRINESNNSAKFKTILLQILAIWGCCFLGFGIHFIAFARFGTTVTRCSTTHLFEDNEQFALEVLAYTLLIPPQACTNIIYVYLIIYVKKKLRSIDVVQVMPKRLIEGTQPDMQEKRKHDPTTLGPEDTSHSGLQEKRKHDHKFLDVRTSQLVTPNTKGHNNSPGINQTTVLSIVEQTAGPSTANESKYSEENDPFTHVQRTALKTRAFGGPGSNVQRTAPEKRVIGGPGTHVQGTAPKASAIGWSETEHKQTIIGRLGWERQQRVLVTFGILLLSLNVFMGPFDSIVIIQKIIGRHLTRNVKYTFVAMAMLNSAFNPLINIWRVKPFRAVIWSNVTKIFESLCFRHL